MVVSMTLILHCDEALLLLCAMICLFVAFFAFVSFLELEWVWFCIALKQSLWFPPDGIIASRSSKRSSHCTTVAQWQRTTAVAEAAAEHSRSKKGDGFEQIRSTESWVALYLIHNSTFIISLSDREQTKWDQIKMRTGQNENRSNEIRQIETRQNENRQFKTDKIYLLRPTSTFVFSCLFVVSKC